ncbi:MAG: proline iminopeptidase [Gammaproteobacteria bacterium]|nr:MAG: proline iminopeptidase [Gammaproteobacteria bacterium]TND05804.1 MAG: proline iminopeptidase [Gammaproteobacteria bacterium]
MLQLFPSIKPYVKHSFAVDAPHILAIDECGNPAGLPVLFIHGGPGAGCEAYHRRFFDPNRYRIILFDQRGCGRSTPHAELRSNNTQSLVSDIEAIRIYLDIERWVLFGGSWGSTLGLVYAQTYPERVLALALRGIFLCRAHEIHWFYQEGASHLYPDYWEDFVKPIPEDERGNLVKAYYKRLSGTDELARMACAKAWSIWEGRLSTLQPKKTVIGHFSDPFTAVSLARIECHYFMNESFLAPNQILDNAALIADIPGVIVHGRYDVVCPLKSAWELHRAWPKSELKIIPDAGHSATEPGIIDALVRATNQFADQFA